MFINILSIKRLKKQLLSINKLIESFFNNFQTKIKHIKKNQQKFLDNRVAIGVAVIFFLTVSYFLIPTLYNKNKIEVLLKNQTLDQFEIDIKFNDKIRYGLFPKPYFYTKDLEINYNDEKIGKVGFSRFYISFKNFFLLNKIEIKNLVLKKAEFRNNTNNLDFFKEILRSKKNKNKFIIDDSNLFLEDKNQDTLFLLKIKNLKVFQDQNNFDHKLTMTSEIFNVPFSLSISDELNSKETDVKIKSKKIRLDISNKLNYQKEDFEGIIDFIFFNKENTFNYTVTKNSLKFNSVENNFEGFMDFKPFYFFSNLSFNYLNFKKLIKNNSIIINLINSGILNNSNLNGNLNITFKKLDNDYINDLSLKAFLDEGNFIIRDLYFEWHDAALINVNDIQIVSDFGEIKFIGEIKFDFNDLDKFYRYYQIKKDNRKKIDSIKLDFIYELNKEKITLDNLTIDGSANRDLDEFFNTFNKKEATTFNKVTFRNFVKGFFSNYDG